MTAAIKPGQQFGLWRVLPDEGLNNFSQKRCIRVLCTGCSREFKRLPSNLLRGKSTCCRRCRNRAIGRARAKTLPIGEMFGSWKLLGDLVIEGQNGRTVEALCTECGNTHLVHWQNLRRGLSLRCSSCGQRRNRQQQLKRQHEQQAS